MTVKRFTYVKNNSITQYQSLPIQEIGKSKALHCQGIVDKLNKLSDENEQLKKILGFLKNDNTEDILNVLNSQENRLWELKQENEQLKSQLYCDDEEGVCNICKYHYLVKDDETEFGYYNSRCKKGHYECARVSLKYCDDFELEGDFE